MFLLFHLSPIALSLSLSFYVSKYICTHTKYTYITTAYICVYTNYTHTNIHTSLPTNKSHKKNKEEAVACNNLFHVNKEHFCNDSSSQYCLFIFILISHYLLNVRNFSYKHLKPGSYTLCFDIVCCFYIYHQPP